MCLLGKTPSAPSVSPYQQAVLACGLDHWHRHQVPDRGMEQSLGYTAAMGTIVMDELASVCGRVEVRFTGVRTDLGIVENDTAILKDWVRMLTDLLEGYDVEFRRMRLNWVAIQDEVDRLSAMCQSAFLWSFLNFYLQQTHTRFTSFSLPFTT